MKTFQFNVDGIDCAHCAKELEEEIGKLDGVSNCSLEFGVHSHLKYDYEGNDAEAIEKAGSADPVKIGEAMAKIAGFKGVSGEVTFNEEHNPIKSAVIIEHKDGVQTFKTKVNP